jgi:hypothetical protein
MLIFISKLFIDLRLLIDFLGHKSQQNSPESTQPSTSRKSRKSSRETTKAPTPDSELIFPDGSESNRSSITNPIIPEFQSMSGTDILEEERTPLKSSNNTTRTSSKSRTISGTSGTTSATLGSYTPTPSYGTSNQTILEEKDVISIRLNKIILNQTNSSTNETSLHSFIKKFNIQTCYLDYKFLNGINETMTVRFSRIMEFNSKHDFIVGKDFDKDNRSKLIKLLAPCFYKNLQECMITVSLVGENDKEVLELATTNLNLLEIIRQGDYSNQPFILSNKHNDQIGSCYITTRARLALVSVAKEIKSFSQKQ